MITSLPAKTGCHAERSRSIFLLFTVYCLLFLSSCGQEEKSVVVPVDVLPKEKMAQVLTDIHLAEAETNLKILPDSASTILMAIGIRLQKIFEKHEITKAQYEKSLSFYIDHPELLNQIYEKVLNALSKMQAGNSKQ